MQRDWIDSLDEFQRAMAVLTDNGHDQYASKRKRRMRNALRALAEAVYRRGKTDGKSPPFSPENGVER